MARSPVLDVRAGESICVQLRDFRAGAGDLYICSCSGQVLIVARVGKGLDVALRLPSCRNMHKHPPEHMGQLLPEQMQVGPPAAIMMVTSPCCAASGQCLDHS